jgi:hypothetical protein
LKSVKRPKKGLFRDDSTSIKKINKQKGESPRIALLLFAFTDLLGRRRFVGNCAV